MATKLLVCTPTHYDVIYSINPWMRPKGVHKANPVKNTIARRQWQRLVQILHLNGATVEEMKGDPILPDLVFTANAGLVVGKTVILSNFKYPERQAETNVYKQWFQKAGYNVCEIHKYYSFEGAGDALAVGEHLYCGFGFRTDWAAYEDYLFTEIGFSKFTPCRLIDAQFYHLDTCFCPLNNGYSLIHSPALHENSLDLIRQETECIEVDKDEAMRFACNAVIIEDTITIPSGCPKTKQNLVERGFKVYDLDMDEFIKAGGACRCLTLRI